MNKRDAILNSTEALLRDEGAVQLTLERVAERAKVSQGGLLYHFPSKERLITGLIQRTIAYFDRDMNAARAALPDQPGRNALAFLNATLEGTWAQDGPSLWTSMDLMASTLAAFSTDKKLVEPIRKAYLRWQKELEADGLDPIQATIVRLAVDGLWYTEMFGFDEFSKKKRVAIVEALRALCTGHESLCSGHESTTKRATKERS